MADRVIRLQSDGPPGTGLQFMGNCDSEPVVAGEPVEHGHEYYATDRGFSAGVWECTPYTAEFAAYPFDEVAFILSGEVTITDASGHTETFRSGDCYLIPKGLQCTWHMPVTTRKYYVILEAGDSADAP